MLTHLLHKKNEGYTGNVTALLAEVTYAGFQCNHLATAIIGLQEKEYSQDFVVLGTKLLWVQKQIYMHPNDFSIAECIRFDNPDKKNKVLLILGVLATAEYIKGIVMYYYNYTSQIPTVLADKLCNTDSNISKQTFTQVIKVKL